MSEGLRQRSKQGGQGSSGDASHGSKKRWERTLESLDLYAKVEEEDKVRTTTGAGMSLLSLGVIALLVFSELRGWLSVTRSEHMKVDAVVEGRVKINFDITLHALPCEQVNLDAMDVAGEQQNGVDHDFLKQRLSLSGAVVGQEAGSLPEGGGSGGVVEAPSPSSPPLPPDYCGPCYGAKEGCCNNCDEVKAAYVTKGWDSGELGRTSEQCIREGRTHEGGAHRLALGPSAGASEGCRLSGHLLVNKVAGNFHIAMGETHQRGAGHIHQFNPAAIANYNVTHTIHTLSFGEAFPGQVNPLDGLSKSPEEGSAVYMYYVKVIPTEYERGGVPVVPGGGDGSSSGGGASNGKGSSSKGGRGSKGGGKWGSKGGGAGAHPHPPEPPASSSSPPSSTFFQYSVSTQFRPAIVHGVRQNVLPGLFFVYEMTPFVVTVSEAKGGSFLHFLTGLCAILGGVITLARLTDTVLHAGTQAMGGKEAVARVAKAGLAKAAAAVVSPGSTMLGGSISSMVGGGGGGSGAAAGGGGLSMNSDLLKSPHGAMGGGGGGGGGGGVKVFGATSASKDA